jgi:hypothetical protein
MAAFLPRALANPQKILLPSKQKHKAGTLKGRRGANAEEIQVRDESASFSRLPIACQVDTLDGNPEDNDGGGISTMDAESAGSHQKAGSSGRQLSGAMVGEAMDYEALGDEDERPEALKIEKRPPEFRERPTGFKRRRGTASLGSPLHVFGKLSESNFASNVGGISSKVGFFLDKSCVSVDAKPMEIGRKEEVYGSVTKSEVRSTSDLVDGEGGHAKGAAPSGPRKQAAGRPKKVFPYGNYDRYYGYRVSGDGQVSDTNIWFVPDALSNLMSESGHGLGLRILTTSRLLLGLQGSLIGKLALRTRKVT